MKLSSRLVNSLFITYKEVVVKRRTTIKELLEESHVGRAQLYKHIQLLKEAGLVDTFRYDRKTYVFATRIVANKEEFAKILANPPFPKSPYEVAFAIKEKIQEYGIEADLFGTAKIHECVPEHQRMTQDVNLVVTQESFKMLDLLLKSLGYPHTGPSKLLYADHSYLVPHLRSEVLVLIKGVKHPANKKKRYYDLEPVLKARRSITLEHAVAGKFLMVPRMRRKVDAEDVADALAYGADIRKVADIIAEVLENYPEFTGIVAGNIQEVEEYLKHYVEMDPHSVEKVRYCLTYLKENLPLPNHLKERIRIFRKTA